MYNVTWGSAIQIGREASRRGNTPRDALFPPSFPYQLRRRRARSRDLSTDEAMSRQTRATLARYAVSSEPDAFAVRIDGWARHHRTSFGSS